MGNRRRKKQKGYNRSVYQSIALISQFGINMLVPIFLLSFLGMALDRYFRTSFWMILLFFVGALAGFRNIFKMAGRIYGKTDRDHSGRDEDKH